jgi:hypothetical protein
MSPREALRGGSKIIVSDVSGEFPIILGVSRKSELLYLFLNTAVSWFCESLPHSFIKARRSQCDFSHSLELLHYCRLGRSIDEAQTARRQYVAVHYERWR